MVEEVSVSKEEVERLYLKEKLTTYEIASQYDCCQATIWKKLHKYGVRPRLSGVSRIDLPKEKLKRLYIEKGLSTWEIEKKYEYPRSTVYRKLKEYGITTRNRAKSHILYSRKNFSGDLVEKAYLIGFKLGDLRARKAHENSETINVDCGSTKREQINLIRELFSEYGRVWVSKPKKGKRQIEAFLDLSFSFLLKNNVDDWILENDKYFAAFLAGFTDAEGSIFISWGRAVYSLGNYNADLLFLIYKKLKEIGIACPKPYEDSTKGCVKKDGYVHNQNYWSLRIGKKSSLLKLFNLIKPYLKHQKRCKDLINAEKNILKRNKKHGLRGLKWGDKNA